jgi:hypothetical protein
VNHQQESGVRIQAQQKKAVLIFEVVGVVEQNASFVFERMSRLLEPDPMFLPIPLILCFVPFELESTI